MRLLAFRGLVAACVIVLLAGDAFAGCRGVLSRFRERRTQSSASCVSCGAAATTPARPVASYTPAAQPSSCPGGRCPSVAAPATRPAFGR